MSTTNTAELKRDFEKWAKDHGYSIEIGFKNGYRDHDTSAAWIGYQAGRSAAHGEQSKYPNPECDEACHYACTEAGAHPPSCVQAGSAEQVSERDEEECRIAFEDERADDSFRDNIEALTASEYFKAGWKARAALSAPPIKESLTTTPERKVMTELRRYDFYVKSANVWDAPGEPAIEIADDGDWVKYEDVIALLNQQGEQTAPGWISVSEKLPPAIFGYKVVCHGTDGTIDIDYASSIHCSFNAAIRDGDTCYFTHWREMPAAPSTAQKDET